MLIEHKHSLGYHKALEKVRTMETEYSPRFSLHTRWDDQNRLIIERSGVSVQVQIEGSSLKVKCDVPWMMRPIQGKIETRIRQELQTRFP